MRNINVKTHLSCYDVHIGTAILPLVKKYLEDRSPNGTVFIVSAEVLKFHESYIKNSLPANSDQRIIVFNDREENKSYKYAGGFFEKFIKLGLNRRSTVVSLGGGVTGDFAGFLSALYMRGISLVHIPTTLLSMVDSSIGGKVAVNLSLGKNIVGAFHQPSMVICDTQFLKTLPQEEIKNGITEILKHGFIGEKETIEILEAKDMDSLKIEGELSELIYRSVKFKSSVVENDEKESGLRAILNFGHTVGHAIESSMKYKGISHGRAVSMGMVAALGISKEMGWLEAGEFNRALLLIHKYKLFNRKGKISCHKIIEHMKYDKKNYNGKINMVLLKGLFNPLFDVQIDEKIIDSALEKYINNSVPVFNG